MTELVFGESTASLLARRWRRMRWGALVLAALGLVVSSLAVTQSRTSEIPFAADSTSETGARALARVLGRQGVRVRPVSSVAAAVRIAGPGSTVLVTPAPWVLADDAAQLVATGADLVLAGPHATLLEAAFGGAAHVALLPGERGALEPGCALPAATNADQAVLQAGFIIAEEAFSALVGCYRDADPREGVRFGLIWQEPGAVPGTDSAELTPHGRITAVFDAHFLTNQRILEEGNAALAIWLLGAHPDVVWLVPDPLEPWAGTGGAPGLSDLLPHWIGPVALALGFTVLGAAVWRGRRFGPLVTEPLPVVVPAGEVTLGRGRLYRAARDRAHAAAGLRGACALRLATRLGIPINAPPDVLCHAVGRATGNSPTQVATVFYGPPPATDRELAALADQLDTLETEVRRA